MNHLAVLILALFCVIVAGHHANLIRAGRKIQHGWWALAYITLAVIFSWALGDRFGIVFDWWLLASAAVIRKPFFDLTLNKFRGLRWDYISPEVVSIKAIGEALKKGKTYDWIYWKLFGRKVWIYLTIHIALILYITIFKLKLHL